METANSFTNNYGLEEENGPSITEGLNKQAIRVMAIFRMTSEELILKSSLRFTTT